MVVKQGLERERERERKPPREFSNASANFPHSVKQLMNVGAIGIHNEPSKLYTFMIFSFRLRERNGVARRIKKNLQTKSRIEYFELKLIHLVFLMKGRRSSLLHVTTKIAY